MISEKKKGGNMEKSGDAYKISGRTEKKEWLLTGLYLLVFFIVASSIALMQPLEDTPPVYANAPDEHARYLVPQYICEHGTIPSGYDEEVRIPGYGSSYALYNVLPYIFMGYVMRLVRLFTENDLYLLYSARFVNVFFGLLMALTVRRLACRIFDEEAKKYYLDWLFCFLIMYLPQNLFLHTYVNTDSMAMLSTALILYAMVAVYQDGFCLKNSAVLCIGVIFCALSYYNAYSYIVSAVLLCLAYFIRKKEDGKIWYDWKSMLHYAVPIVLVILFGAGWWFLRNYLLYDGDMLGLRTARKMQELYAVDKVNPLTSLTYQQMGYTPWQMMEETNYLTILYASFIGAYGSLSIFANIWIYRIYKLLIFGGVLGYLLLLPWAWKKETGKSIFFHVNLLFCIFMTLFLGVYYAYTSDFQAQGRYVMPILIPVMLYVVKGMERVVHCLLIGGTTDDDGKRPLLAVVTKRDADSAASIGRKIAALGVILIMAVIVFMLLWMVYGIAMPIYCQFQPVII